MPAPKGNKYAVDNDGGRPRLFSSPRKLRKLINEYFEMCDSITEEIVVGRGENKRVLSISRPDPYDVAGLCSHIGCSRETLLRYEKDQGFEEFHDTVKKAKIKIEANLVKRALKKESSEPVSIFLLKNNFGYKDKSEVETITRKGTPVTKEKAKKIINELG